jgi:hypothetical protein
MGHDHPPKQENSCTMNNPAQNISMNSHSQDKCATKLHLAKSIDQLEAVEAQMCSQAQKLTSSHFHIES